MRRADAVGSVRPLRLVALAVLTATLASSCAERKETPPPGPTLSLTRVSFTDLPGWPDDDPSEALSAFQRSCGRWAKQAADKSVGGERSVAGTVADWRPACAAAAATPATATAARSFFETAFSPFAVSDGTKPDGLFTGYYEPRLQGSRVRDGRYRYPLYRRPADLVSVDLGQFDPELQGRRVAGRVEEGGWSPTPIAPRSTVAPWPAAISSCSGSTTRSTGSSWRSRARARSRLPDGGDHAGRLRGPERAALPRDRQGPDRDRRDPARAGLDAGDPRLARSQSRAGAGDDGQERLLRLLPRDARPGRRARAGRRPGRPAHARALARGRPQVPAAGRAALARHHRARSGR